MNPRDTPFARKPDFIFRRIADELILVPIRQRIGDLQSLYTLTPVAAQIWEWLDGTNGVEAIAQRITDEFDVTVEVAKADLVEFLTELEKIGAAGPVAESRS
jgi:Coenzyme PQQ synthesis protein D (PqqD)